MTQVAVVLSGPRIGIGEDINLTRWKKKRLSEESLLAYQLKCNYWVEELILSQTKVENGREPIRNDDEVVEFEADLLVLTLEMSIMRRDLKYIGEFNWLNDLAI